MLRTRLLCSIVKFSVVWERGLYAVLWKLLLCVWGEVDTWEYLREAHGGWGSKEHKKASGNLWHFWESPSGATAGERNSSARLSCRKSYMEVQRWSFCKSSSTKNEAASRFWSHPTPRRKWETPVESGQGVLYCQFSINNLKWVKLLWTDCYVKHLQFEHNRFGF